jgi:hypothetical protein
MSGPGAENRCARHLSHFFVERDGSSYEISVEGGFIHIRGTSFKKYDEEGTGTREQLQGTELTVTYKSVLDVEAQKRGEGRKMILHTAATGHRAKHLISHPPPSARVGKCD